MSRRGAFAGFVGSAFRAQSQRQDVQDLWNWYLEPASSPSAKSARALLPCPGFETFATLPTTPVRGLFAINDRTFAVGGNVLYELTRTAGVIARTLTAIVAPAAPVITISKLAKALAPPTAPVLTHGGDLGSTTYGYRVTATNDYGETLPSPEGTSSHGNTALSATNWNIVSWSSVEGATGYKVYRTTGGAGAPQLVQKVLSTVIVINDIGGTTTAATLPTVDTSGEPVGTTIYGYKITAVIGLGETEASPEGTTTTGPKKLTSTDYTIVTWKKVPGARGYKVYRTTGIVGTDLTPPPRLIATVLDGDTLTVNDTGDAGDAVIPPATNTSGTGITGGVVDDGMLVSWASSGDAGHEMFLVSGGYGYCYDLTTDEFSQVVKGATFAGYIDSYFVTLDAGTSTLRVSEALDGFNWDPTQVYQRTRAGDRWLAMAVTSNYIWLIGSQTGEVWTGTGDPDTRFIPYDPVFLETGIVAPSSMTRISSGDTMMWVAQDKDGAGTVVRVNGYTPEKVSTLAVDFSIQHFTTIADGFAFSYQQEGHTFYVVTFPSGTTWVYDTSTNEWHRRGDWDPNAMRFKPYRPQCHALAFGGSGHGINLVGDGQTGIIARMRTDIGLDIDGSVIRRQRDCPHLADRDMEMTFDRLQIDMEVGLGLATGQGSDPTMMLSYSNNGGKTWGKELWRSAGKQGEYRIQVAWTRLGTAKDRVFRVVVSDPIPWRIVGAWLEAEGAS